MGAGIISINLCLSFGRIPGFAVPLQSPLPPSRASSQIWLHQGSQQRAKQEHQCDHLEWDLCRCSGKVGHLCSPACSRLSFCRVRCSSHQSCHWGSPLRPRSETPVWQGSGVFGERMVALTWRNGLNQLPKINTLYIRIIYTCSQQY